jgi:hypothetical protein
VPDQASWETAAAAAAMTMTTTLPGEFVRMRVGEPQYRRVVTRVKLVKTNVVMFVLSHGFALF